MKKELWLITLMSIAGGLYGYAVVCILNNIALPMYFNHLLTLQEKMDFEVMGAALTSWRFDWTTMAVAFLLFGLAASYFLLTIINPNYHWFAKQAGHKRIKGKGVTAQLAVCLAIVLVIGAAILLEVRMDLPFSFSLIGNMYADMNASAPIGLAVTLLLTGFAWYTLGEMGWAGDLSSWKPGREHKKSQPLACLGLGGLVAVLAYGISMLASFAFSKYFILVSEVFDQSPETSLLGFQYLNWSLPLLVALSFCTLSGFIIALSPAQRETGYRKKWLIFPTALLALVVIAMFGYYRYAAAKYDLDKKNLVEAVGIEETGGPKRTTILFSPPQGEFTLQKHSPEVHAYGMAAQESRFEASVSNVAALQEYIEARRQGSIFFYSAHDALLSSHMALWDFTAFHSLQGEMARDFLLQRTTHLVRLAKLPITESNRAILDHFANEDLYYAGGKAAGRLARAYIHFGDYGTAEKWLSIAKERSRDGEESELTIPTEPPLTTGNITGRMILNGQPLAGAKVALLYSNTQLQQLSPLTFRTNLADGRSMDADGRFSFTRLGSGRYQLAVLVDTTLLPHDLGEEITISNPPQLVDLNSALPAVDLGDIVLKTADF